MVELDGKTLKFTNLDKVLYPATGFTKGALIDYYVRIAPTLLPHLRERALTLKRYPNGVDQPYFYEKRCPSHAPDWIQTVAVYSRHNEADINFCVAANEATLAWLANLACIEIHPLLSRAQVRPQCPTAMIFDFDPGPPAGLLDCVRVAFAMRDVLKHIGLEGFTKTSGGKGLHLWVPLNTDVTFEQTRAFSHSLALLLERQLPDQVVSNMRKDLRGGKVFIDWSQNAEHKTTVSVYSVRARTEPTVSTPVEWDEMKRALSKNEPQKLMFRTDQLLARVKKKGDLFAPVLTLKQKLPSM